MTESNDIKMPNAVSAERLQEMLNGMEFWGSATGIPVDDIIAVFSETQRYRQVQAATSIQERIPEAPARLQAVKSEAVSEFADYQDALAEKYADISPGCAGE